MRCIYVNSKGQPYAEKLVSGSKLFETRTRDVFRSFFQDGNLTEEVGVIQTGHGFPVLLGIGTLFCGFKAEGAFFESLREATCIPAGDEYDIEPDGFKWMYAYQPRYKFKRPVRLDDPRIEVVPHNRSFCEILKREA